MDSEEIQQFWEDSLSSIAIAKQGSLKHTLAIVSTAKDSEIPLPYLSDTLDVFLTHLTMCQSPKHATPETIQLAHASLRGIVHMQDDIVESPLRSSLTRSLSGNWSSILVWAKFFVLNNSVQSLAFISSQKKMKSTVLEICLMAPRLHDVDGFLRMLDEHPILIELIFHIWLTNDTTVYKESEYTSCYIIELYAYHHADKALDAYLTMSDGNADQVATTLLGRLSDATRRFPDSFNLDNINCYINLIRPICMNSSKHPLAQAVWKKEGTVVISGVISVLAQNLPKLMRNDATEPLQNCFVLLSMALASENSVPCVLQALQSGALYSLVACSPAFTEFSDIALHALDFMLKDVYTYHFNNPAIISAYEVEINKVAEHSQEQVLSSKIGGLWKAVNHFFLERFVFKCLFDEHRKIDKSNSNTCDNCQRPGIDSQTPLRKCGGCKHVLYCSGKCRDAAWKSHKEECKVLRQQRQQPDDPKSRSFQCALAIHDVRRHLPGLRRLAARKYPGASFDSLAISLNYCAFPPILDVFPLVDAALRIEEPFGREMIEKVQQSNGSEVFMHFLAPSGQGSATNSSCTTLPWKRIKLFTDDQLHNVCPRDGRSLHKTVFQDVKGNPLEAAWDLADDLMALCEVTSETFLGAGGAARLRDKVYAVCKAR
ncbi:hypothetical protein DFH11DRAFT_1571579 [Phellopilus nigrolimitatus]|nr:hypothetical protein DFH11DRAFT_1571579 [Phellopilus nigrolimitatus]